MECARVRKLLSEYIDNTLDTKIAFIVGEHLDQCEDCDREHASLNMLVNALGRLEPVEPPENFLEKINKRIDAPSWLDRIRHFLFFPARVKIPVELTAITSAVVLVFIIFYTIHTNEYGRDPGSGKTGFVQERGVIYLALSLKAKPKDRPLPSENIVSVVSGARPKDHWKPESELQTIGQEVSSSEPDDLVSNLKDIVSGIGGTLSLKEDTTTTDYPLDITIEIPAINYQLFLRKIGHIGSIQAPAPTLPDGYDGRVRIQFQVISPN